MTTMMTESEKQLVKRLLFHIYSAGPKWSREIKACRMAVLREIDGRKRTKAKRTKAKRK